MPLLGKEEFTLKTLPPDLGLRSEVFYCEITGEAFVSYDEYFERQMLCSSLLWTCSVTGKTGLTYADALKSENESQSLLSSIPRVLQKVLLFLMSHLENFNANVTIAVLAEYTNLRYFIGENVQILSKNKNRRVNGYIRDVIPPDEYDTSCSYAYGVYPLSYQYVVEICEFKKNTTGSKQSSFTREVVPVSRISRPKCLLTREKIRLFLKQHISPKTGRYEPLTIKEESIYKFGLGHLKWEDIFKGPTPNFVDDTITVKAFNKRFAEFSDLPNEDGEVDDDDEDDDSNISDDNDNENSMQVYKKKSTLLSSQKSKILKREEKNKSISAINEIKEKKKVKRQQKLKEKLEKKKLKKLKMKNKQNKEKLKGKKKKEKVPQEEQVETKESKEAKIEEKKREKESRRKFEEDSRSWLEKRDDLLCDDLKPLPLATVFDCNIEDSYISDSLSIIEFVNSFSDYLYLDNAFPSGISIHLFSQILTDNDVTGPFFDLIKSLLYTIISSNSDESDINAESDLNINENNDDFDSLHLNAIDEDETSNRNYYTSFANYWVTTYFGTREQLVKLKLDAFTLTEILRIYILKAHKSKSKSMYITDPDYIKFASKLTTYTVFAFDKQDRIKLIKLLIDEIVKVPVIRQKIDEAMEEIFKLKTQIRHLNAAFSKWLRDNPIRQRMRKKRPGLSENKEESGAQVNADDLEGEATPEEREKFKSDKTEKELEMKAAISELKAEIRKWSAFCRPRPLGVDRSYRRYWIFQSVPGLIVEHPVDEVYTRSCLDCPVPMAKPIIVDYLPNARRRKRKNKEATKSVKDNENQSSSDDQPNLDELFSRCTGCHSTCSVHGVANINKRIQWSFYTKEQFDDLIDSLNVRGFRESELKISLNFEKKSIFENHLKDFDGVLLNRNYIPPVEEVSEETGEEIDEENNLRKSERIQRIQLQEKSVDNKHTCLSTAKHIKSSDNNKYSNLLPMAAHCAEFKDQLISLEESIFNSCFGSFKYEEREDWYKNISLNFGGDRIKSMKNYTYLFRTLAKSVRPFFLSPPLSVAQDSSAPSPSDKENIENILPKVPMLSEKWVDVLKVADDIDSSRLLEGISNDYESSYGITNISQLFVNLYILNKSIKWDLSAMKTANRCRICRRKANDELILCDMCNRGYHIYCLNPPIASVDDIEGDWFCYSCHPRPRNTAKNTATVKNSSSKISHQEANSFNKEVKMSAVSYKEIDENDIADGYSDSNTSNCCLVCKKPVSDKYSHITCKTCNKLFHLKCVDLARIPRSWSCLPCEEIEQYNAASNSDDNSDLRRSRRKRKPNNYYEYDPVDNDNRYKNRRYSLNNNSENIIIRRSSRRLGNDDEAGDETYEPSSRTVLDRHF